VWLRKHDETRDARGGVFLPEFSARSAKQRNRRKERRGKDAMRDRDVVYEAARGKTPLVVRGSFPRVFLGFGVFLEAGFLFCGSYLLADAILQPKDAGTFSVVGGGMFLGFATVLLFYLAWPGKRRAISRREECAIQMAEVSPDKYEAAVQNGLQPNWAGDKKEGLFRPM